MVDVVINNYYCGDCLGWLHISFCLHLLFRFFLSKYCLPTSICSIIYMGINSWVFILMYGTKSNIIIYYSNWVLTIRSTFRMAAMFFQEHPSFSFIIYLFILVLPYFLGPWDIAGSPCVFLTLVYELTTFLISTDSFHWKIVFRYQNLGAGCSLECQGF